MLRIARKGSTGSKTEQQGCHIWLLIRGERHGVPVQAGDVLLESLILPLQGIGLLQLLPEISLLPPPVTLLRSQLSTHSLCPVRSTGHEGQVVASCAEQSAYQGYGCKAHAGLRRQAGQCMPGTAVLREQRAHPRVEAGELLLQVLPGLALPLCLGPRRRDGAPVLLGSVPFL